MSKDQGAPPGPDVGGPDLDPGAAALAASKRALREQVLAAREAFAGRDRASALALERLLASPEHARAGTVLWFVGFGTEVDTREGIERDLRGGKRVAVPWCTRAGGVRELALWRLEDLDELEAGTWGILEPPVARRGEADRQLAPQALDLVVVPGVAFDRRGGRLGYGAGYYDRLLARLRPDAARLGLAFECQLVDAVPMGPNDVPVDGVVTERARYPVPPAGPEREA